MAKLIADRHYNRQNPDAAQFVPPGRCIVLRAPHTVWVTSWPFGEYVQHDWPGAWVNSMFRNEGGGLSSELIREAIAATRWFWTPPDEGLITMIDRSKVRPKRDPGYCYLMAGFEVWGETKGGLRVLGMAAEAMPDPEPPLGIQLELGRELV